MSEDRDESKVSECTALIVEETTHTSSIKLPVILSYSRVCNWFLTIPTLLFYILTIGAIVAATFWLAEWSDAESNASQNNNNNINNSALIRFTVCDGESGPQL